MTANEYQTKIIQMIKELDDCSALKVIYEILIRL